MDTKVFSKQLEEIVSEYREHIERSQYKDGSDNISTGKVQEMVARALAAIERATGNSSVYYKRAETVLGSNHHEWNKLAGVIGISESLKSDIDSGYMVTLEELVHADVFSDFLEMAEHLLSTGYKDAAAVIVGSTLESHMKKLCVKHGVATEQNGRSRKADTLNADLVKASAYSKLEQKNVTAWLGLRNNAAHGEYDQYEKQQVQMMLMGVQDFMTRNTA